MGFCLTPRSVRDSQHRPVDDGRSVWFFEQDRSSDGTLAKDLDQAEYDAELIRQVVTTYIFMFSHPAHRGLGWTPYITESDFALPGSSGSNCPCRAGRREQR